MVQTQPVTQRGLLGSSTAIVVPFDAPSLVYDAAKTLKPIMGNLIQICADGDTDSQTEVNAAIAALLEAVAGETVTGSAFNVWNTMEDKTDWSALQGETLTDDADIPSALSGVVSTSVKVVGGGTIHPGIEASGLGGEDWSGRGVMRIWFKGDSETRVNLYLDDSSARQNQYVANYTNAGQWQQLTFDLNAPYAFTAGFDITAIDNVQLFVAAQIGGYTAYYSYAELNNWVQLGHRMVQPGSIAVSGYVEDTDFECDDNNGRIITIPHGSIATGEALTVGYNYGTGSVYILSGTIEIDANITYTINELDIVVSDGATIRLADGADCNAILPGGDGWKITGSGRIDGNGNNQTTSCYGVYVNAQDNGRIEGPELVNWRGYYSAAIFFRGGAKSWTVIRSRINDCFHGVYTQYTEYSYNITISECSFERNTGAGVYPTGLDIGWTIDTSYFDTNGYCHIIVGGSDYSYAVNVGNCHFTHCTGGSGVRFYRAVSCSLDGSTFYDDGRDNVLISQNSHDIVVSTNVMYLPGGVAIYAESTSYNCRFIGNMIFDPGVGSNRQAIAATGTGSGFFISENSIYESRGGSAYCTTGILVNGPDSCGIDHNYIYGVTTYAIWVLNSDDTTVTYNYIDSVQGNNNGIYFQTCDNGKIDGNIIRNTYRAIYIGANSDYVTVEHNDWTGCTLNEITTSGSATNVRMHNNIGKDGLLFLLDDDPITIAKWVSHNNQNPSLRTIPVGVFCVTEYVQVLEAFDSDGADELTGGYDADTDALFTTIDVSTTGFKAVTHGAEAGYIQTQRAMELYYVNGGSEPTTGQALVLTRVQRVPTKPA